MNVSEIIANRIFKLLGVDISITDEEKSGLDQEIDNLIQSISKCKNVIEAEKFFNELQSLQTLLAELLFKHDISLSDKQRRVVRECERLDDMDLRIFIFNAIKSGTFP